MHIIFTPFPFLSFFVSQENMAADHMCFVLLAWLSSLEVVSHTVRRELEVSLSTRACLGEAPPGCCRVCGGGLLYVMACLWLWALKCVILSLWCEAVIPLPPPFSFTQTSLGNTIVKLVF